MPGDKLFFEDFSGAVAAADEQAAEAAGIQARGGEHLTKPAIFEPQHGHTRVLDFESLGVVGPHGGEGDNALHGVFTRRQVGHRRPRNPLEAVDAVDRLIHQRPAAVEGPGALPASGAVVGVVPPPGHVAGGHGELTKPAGGGRRVHGLDHRVEPLREDRAKRHVLPRGGCDQAVDPPEGDLEWLLADDGHALSDRRERRVEVGPGGRGHRDEVGLLAANHPGGVVVPGAAKLGSEGPPLLLRAAAGRHEFHAGDSGQRPRVQPGDRSDTDDGRPHTWLLA